MLQPLAPSMPMTSRKQVKRAVGVTLLTLVALGAIGVGGSTGARAAPPSWEGVPAFGHVFVIIGENTGLSQVNPSNSPYLLGTVEPQAAWLTDYFATTHYSEANYVAMTSGQFTSCEQADGTPATCHQNVDNLFHQLDTAHTSWQSWMESMPAPCYLYKAGSDAGLNLYAPKHNPAVLYDDVEGTGGVWSATNPSQECLTQDIPAGTTGPNDMTWFNQNLSQGTVARFNFIVPNECEDAHNNCKPSGNPITQFDDFLAREVPLIQASPAFGSNGVIIITFDEGIINGPNHADKFGNGGNVVFAVISPLAVPGRYGGLYDHYGFLRTMEDGFQLSGYLGNATLAAPINPIWA